MGRWFALRRGELAAGANDLARKLADFRQVRACGARSLRYALVQDPQVREKDRF
jgi:hypothetical protein